MGYTDCDKCGLEMEFIGFDDKDDKDVKYPDEIWECPKCGERAYVN